MYIKGFCSIGSFGVINSQSSLSELKVLPGVMNASVEPNYSSLIPPMQLRRMTKPLRIAVAAGKMCLEQAGVTMPDAIHIGTAYGMLSDSEQFLKKMIVQEEQMLNPTAFIQSTHNTVSGQIALGLGCTAHNMTFVHNAHSFESALLDAELYLNDAQGTQSLLGVVDECIPASYEILKRFKVYNSETVAGEGASFFVVSPKPHQGILAKIDHTATGIGNKEKMFAALKQFVTTNAQNMDVLHPDNSLVLYGCDEAIINDVFPLNKKIAYKQYCGEYVTSIGFALSFALLHLKEQSSLSHCWIVNRFGSYFSFMLVSRA